MKKIKIFLLLGIVISLCGCSLFSQDKSDNKFSERIEQIIEGNLSLNNFVCQEADEVGIKYLAYNYLILNDGSLYERLTSGDQYYSNDQKCKKIETDIKFDIKGSQLIGNDGKKYSFLNNNGETYIEANRLYDAEDVLVKDSSIISYEFVSMDKNDKYYQSNSNSFYYTKYLVVKSDGALYENYYKVYYEYNGSKTPSKLMESNLLYSHSDYGKIKYSRMHDDFYLNDILVTENGFYIEKEVETEECKKYADVKCEVKMVLSPVYDKIKDKIVYLGLNYLLLDDHRIVSSNIFYQEIEEE